MDEAQELQRAVERARSARGLPVKPEEPPRPIVSTPPPTAASTVPESSGGRRMTQAEADRRMAQDDRRSAWQASGFPHRHRIRAWRMDEFGDEWSAARNKVLAAVLADSMVFLVGDRGTGKTQLAASAACEACMVHGVLPRYYRTADLIGRFKTQVFGEGVDEFRFMASMARLGLLVLDELQDRYDTATEDRVLTRLIDHRYGAMKPTIFIANLRPEALDSTLKASVMSRAEECGVLIECNWRNYRGAETAP